MSKVKESNKFIKFTSKQVKWVAPTLQVVIAICALIVLLGLAVKGAQSYLINIDEMQRLIAGIVVIVLLAYSIATGIKRII